MEIIRTPRANQFLQVANEVARDRRLSYRARGVLVFLLSLPDGYALDSDSIADHTPKEGRDAVRAAMRELVSAGYLHRERSQNGKGQWTTRLWITDTPTVPAEDSVSAGRADDGFPVVGQPAVGQPVVGGPGGKDLNTETNTNPLTPNAAALGEPCAKHKRMGRQHARCRDCGTAGRPKCDRESSGRLSERCRAGDGRSCTTDWCECPHHPRRPS